MLRPVENSSLVSSSDFSYGYEGTVVSQDESLDMVGRRIVGSWICLRTGAKFCNPNK